MPLPGLTSFTLMTKDGAGTTSNPNDTLEPLKPGSATKPADRLVGSKVGE
jgi:hypothetical protein